MRPVAKRLARRVLAAAEEHLAGLLGGVFDRVEIAALMRAVTERLFLALPAGAPEVILAFLYVDGEGGGLGDLGGVGQCGSPVGWLGCRVTWYGRKCPQGALCDGAGGMCAARDG